MLVHEGLRVVRLKRTPAGEHLEKHHAKTVDVGALVYRHPQRLLRRQIVWRAEYLAMLGTGNVRIGILGDTEVSQAQAAIGADHHVVRFHVAMHDALRMHRGKCPGHLQQDRYRDLGAQLTCDQLAQVASGEVLHRNICVGFGKPLMVNTRHVRMVDLRHQRELLDETLHHLRTIFIIVGRDRQQFEDVLCVGFELFGKKHLRHATLAKLADHPVAINGDRAVSGRRARIGCENRLRRISRPARRDDGGVCRYRVTDHFIKLRIRARPSGQSGDFDNVDRTGASLDQQLAGPTRDETAPCGLGGGTTDDDAPAQLLGLAFQAGCQIDRIADHGRLGRLAGPHSTHRNVTGMHAYANGEFRHRFSRMLLANPGLEAMRGQHHQHCRLERAFGMIVAARTGIEHGYQSVAQEFHDPAGLVENWLTCLAEKCVQELHHLLGFE